MAYIERNTYLDRLWRNKDMDTIKVISGVRRSGKSTLLKMFEERLLSEGVSEERIQVFNFENPDFDQYRDSKLLYEKIKSQLVPGVQNYIILDEIQLVQEFERAVDGLYILDNTDIYITGSNAYFMSGELATYLTGRYFEVKLYPLSFKEFMSVQNGDVSIEEGFNKYLQGTLPFFIRYEDVNDAAIYLEDVLNAILLKDVVQRLKIRDVDTLNRIMKVLMSSVGSVVSIAKITNTLKSDGNKISDKTVERYVQGIVDSLLIYRAPRFDDSGRKYLKSRDKFYLVDPGMRRIMISNRPGDLGHTLENVIYLELLRRDYTVFVGELADRTEVDFVAVDKQGGRQYIRVSLSTLDETTLARELHPLEKINDNYPKILLTLDTIERTASYNGIQKMNALDWLLE
ncbi:ATP-binding protein [Weissella cibaria]|uniref:ATP-binding protein n=1 Tax=Weissella cibaria TaxID=137591 RepID=UPI00119163ED|nr:ATP-binding protein [Weissella cibaria]MCA1356725.1 ATP-binding protein [Weissella cibaria]MDQ2125664.1 ATP-binding protein [Weissella cibaria]MDQ2157825.1 ATP-binding protein [Weissella cibaria]TVV34859.1 ATP-binding protein [Weissella cibaria]